MNPSVDATVLVCTYNRSADLRELLESCLAQKVGPGLTFEVLVVDNNSNDDTQQVVRGFARDEKSPVRYLFEGRQGKSFALNTGLAAARGDVYLIADDDMILPPDYVRNIVDVFRKNPGISFVGGKILPKFESPPPEWLTERHWSPIALTNFGEQEFHVGSDRPVCLLAGAFRRADVQAVKGYDPELTGIGQQLRGAEDTDIYFRLFRAGRTGLYQPHISALHKVQAGRLTKRYHRRWHRDHGWQYAVMRHPEVERSRIHLLGLPAHMFRQAAGNLFQWCRLARRRNSGEAFYYETQLWFFAGFLNCRVRSWFSPSRR